MFPTWARGYKTKGEEILKDVKMKIGQCGDMFTNAKRILKKKLYVYEYQTWYLTKSPREHNLLKMRPGLTNKKNDTTMSFKDFITGNDIIWLTPWRIKVCDKNDVNGWQYSFSLKDDFTEQ